MPLQPGKEVTLVTDRTLPEIYPSACKISRLDLLDFCWLLKGIGVDIIEINAELAQKIVRLPDGLEYIFRIHTLRDMDICISRGIKRCVVRKELLLLPGAAEAIKANSLKVTLEVNANTLEGIYNLEKFRFLKGFDTISCLRISGLGIITAPVWADAASYVRNTLGVKTDICPGNRFSQGTAAALEAVEHGMDYVTAAFAGYGRNYSYTPLEELLVSMKILLSKKLTVDFSTLPELSRRFKKFTQREIPESKAIIGKDIFKYESGIHAGGIEKDPSIYEPFEPSIVGQKRAMTIGKHSGRQSVRKKLMELELVPDEHDLVQMLQLIREKSIQKGRNLNDDELKALYFEHAGFMTLL